MLTPKSLNVGLQLRAKGTIVVQTGDTTIDFEAGYEEKFGLEESLTLLALIFFCKIDNTLKIFNTNFPYRFNHIVYLMILKRMTIT